LGHDIAALKFVKVAGSTGVGWDWQFQLRVPPLFDPRAVEIDIFADLTISKEKSPKCQRKLSVYSKFFILITF
jgi:hypothetical protein